MGESMVYIKVWKRLVLFLMLISVVAGCATGTKAADKNGSRTGGQKLTGAASAMENKSKSGETEKNAI